MGPHPIHTTRAHRRVGASMIVTMLIAALAWTGTGTASAVRKPTHGAYFGAYVQTRGGQSFTQSVASFERLIGRKAKIVNKYHSFSDHNYSAESDLLRTGHVPMISWRGTDSSPDPRRASKIANGDYDSLLRSTADALKRLDGRVLLRFNWEMDQPKGDRQYIGTPDEFKMAWRHVYRILRARGADNVEFVWAPRAGSFNKNIGQSFYPGRDYLQWIGGSAVPINNCNSFHSIFGGFYDWASQQKKPLLIWVGLRERCSTGWKAGWIDGASWQIRKHMPKVKAFVYYNALSPKGYRFFVDTSGSSLRAYKEMGDRNYFRGGVGGRGHIWHM